MRCTAGMMSSFPHHARPEPERRTELRQAAAATAALLVLFSVFAFAPRRDASKVVAGVPCSILSEQQISETLGTPMRLMPTSGTICQYVSTGGAERTLFVVARHAALPPDAARGVAVRGIGDGAIRVAGTTYVRYGPRWFALIAIPQAGGIASAFAVEMRLAKRIDRPLIARMH